MAWRELCIAVRLALKSKLGGKRSGRPRAPLPNTLACSFLYVRSPSISEGDKREESPVPDRKTESAKEIGRNVLWLPGVSRNVSVAHMEEIMVRSSSSPVPFPSPTFFACLPSLLFSPLSLSSIPRLETYFDSERLCFHPGHVWPVSS